MDMKMQNAINKPLPFVTNNLHWNAEDDKFRVAIYDTQKQIQFTFHEDVLFSAGWYDEDTALFAEYKTTAESQYLKLSTKSTGQPSVGKIKTASDLATLPYVVRGQAKNAGLSPTPQKYQKCSGSVVGNEVLVTLPPCFDPYVANDNILQKDRKTFVNSKDFPTCTDAELLKRFRMYRQALEVRGHYLVAENGAVKMRISKTINL